MSIDIIGMGMGNPNNITLGAIRAIEKADIIVGADRLLKSIPASFKAQRINCIRTADILNIIEDNKDSCIAVVFSGDIGFYSGAVSLMAELKDKNIEYSVHEGISSIQYLSGKIGIPWQDFKVVSLHGRENSFIDEVKENRYTYFLLDRVHTPNYVVSELLKVGMKNLSAYVGEKLSYKDEKISFYNIETELTESFEALSVMLIINEASHRELFAGGLSDDSFIRGNVPMTKSEVRALILSKLKINSGDTVYDIGAGTGSVSVELALANTMGEVYAFEKNSEGIDLILKNQQKFGLDNLLAVEGEAPGILENYPEPDAVFIGGSSGNMQAIVETVLSKNTNARFCATAILLDTVAEIIKMSNEGLICGLSVTEVNISKSREGLDKLMMTANNPIYIMCFNGKEKCL